MTAYFIIPSSTYAATDWTASNYAIVAPVEIVNGDYAGAYAVNTAILDSDSCFESFRELLEALPTAELDSDAFTSISDETLTE